MQPYKVNTGIHKGYSMEVSLRKLYLYDFVREVHVLDDGMCYSKIGIGTMNHNQPMKAHKGLDNKLVFRVFGPDRIPFDVAAKNKVYARITHTETNVTILEKICKLGPAKGIITLELDGGDIEDAVPGIYHISLIRTSDFVYGSSESVIEKPIYTDMENNVVLELQITDQAYKQPARDIVITKDDWTPDSTPGLYYQQDPCYYSKRIPGARVLNHKESIHSLATTACNFTGVLEIWGTLEEDPDPNVSDRWFKINPEEGHDALCFNNHTGTDAWSFVGNFMWMKLKLIPAKSHFNAGEMVKVSIRL